MCQNAISTELLMPSVSGVSYFNKNWKRIKAGNQLNSMPLIIESVAESCQILTYKFFGGVPGASCQGRTLCQSLRAKNLGPYWPLIHYRGCCHGNCLCFSLCRIGGTHIKGTEKSETGSFKISSVQNRAINSLFAVISLEDRSSKMLRIWFPALLKSSAVFAAS